MLTTIAQYREAPEAYLAKGVLAAEGIEAVIIDEQVVGINWLYSNAIGGVKLTVEPESAKLAVDVLREQVAEQDVQQRSSSPIRLHQVIGVLTIFMLAGVVGNPAIIVALPVLALNRRRGLTPN